MRKAKGQLCVTRASSTQFQHHQCDTDTGRRRRRRRSRCWNRMPAAFMHPISMRSARVACTIYTHAKRFHSTMHAAAAYAAQWQWCALAIFKRVLCSYNLHTDILRLQYARLARKRVRTQSNSQPHHTRFMRAYASHRPHCALCTPVMAVCVCFCAQSMHIIRPSLWHTTHFVRTSKTQNPPAIKPPKSVSKTAYRWIRWIIIPLKRLGLIQ